jgi:hypothetical protein
VAEQVLLIYTHLLPSLKTGPDADPNPPAGYDEEGCHKYMWTNVFYVSNLYPNQFGAFAEGNLGCMDWSWYLS